jgi:hypothetical protein
VVDLVTDRIVALVVEHRQTPKTRPRIGLLLANMATSIQTCSRSKAAVTRVKNAGRPRQFVVTSMARGGISRRGGGGWRVGARSREGTIVVEWKVKGHRLAPGHDGGGGRKSLQGASLLARLTRRVLMSHRIFR